jgi:hypothetical protein
MFLSKRYKLQKSGHTYVVTIPATIIDHFKLDGSSSLNMSYEDRKLVIDLDSAAPARPRKNHAPREVAA